jgi:phosphotriesterase-related protein
VKLKEEGLLHKILISHDAGWYNPEQENGGNFRSFTDVFEYLIPLLQQKGFSSDDIDLLLAKNPQKAYGIIVRALVSTDK